MTESDLKSTQKPIAIQPCPNKWEDMAPQSDGNRYCRQCSKSVHDMSGLSPEAALDFLRANPGSCGSFFIDQVHILPQPAPLPGVIRAKTMRQRIHWRKAAAAAAVLTLLGGTLTAHPTNKPASTHISALTSHPDSTDPSTNTLLTGVVVEQAGRIIRGKIHMMIFQDGAFIEDWLEVENGLFHLDLAGKIDPQRRFTIKIAEQSTRDGKISGFWQKISLRKAQNLTITVQMTYRPRRTAGRMIQISDL